MVECTGFENRRSFPVTEGSNPSSSEEIKDIHFDHLMPLLLQKRSFCNNKGINLISITELLFLINIFNALR